LRLLEEITLKIYLIFAQNCITMKFIYAFLILIISVSVTARELEGYIILKNGNKIYGTIQIPIVKQANGEIIINNINYLPLYISVYFREKGTKKFKEYFADDIDGFSFKYDEQEIFFFSMQLPVQSFGKEKYLKRFLRLLVNGTLILFDAKTQILYGNNYSEETDYYISDRNNRILKVSDNNYDSFEEYLIKELKIEKEFIHNQSCKINVSNLKEIIFNYNSWCRTKN
jgi:hypothetical protein